MSYLFGGFGSILFIAALLVYVAWKPLGQPPQQSNLVLAVVLTCVFFAQAAFAFYQDFSSSRVMASTKTMLPEHCVAVRDAIQQNVPRADLVPGDLLCIKMGDRLPADVRFIAISTDAHFDRSILTGETVPMHGSVDSTDDNYLETACIGMAGTHCVAGYASGVVVATGDRTVFGRIAKFSATPKEGQTSLQREISHFVKIMVGMMLSIIALIIIVWAAWLRRYHSSWISVPDLMVDCVTIAVAFVPEGLPIAVISSLTITASIMKRNKISCKSLKTIETLGSVSVICSDKTGTLTKNQMTVTDCMIGRLVMTAAQVARAAKVDAASNDGPEELGIMGGVCNAGEFDAATLNLPAAERNINGDATDQAILRFAESIIPVVEIRKQFRTIFKVAFNSKNKFMIQIIQPVGSRRSDTSLIMSDPDAPLLLMIKGAPDVLLGRCDAIMADDGKSTRPITSEDYQFVERIKNQWSSQGRRVILLARKKLPMSMHSLSTTSRDYEERTMEEATEGLEFVGLVAIVDPPRDEILDVVRTLRSAGIRVFMVTGDFKLTAEAVAVQCGIITRPGAVNDVTALSSDNKSLTEPASFVHNDVEASPTRAIALSGAEMNQLGHQEWNKLCDYQEIVFARTTPEQKLRIVKELQAREKIVGSEPLTLTCDLPNHLL
ncbi:MAG: hypothetical protein M1822_010051 [Bathelium mastoideum]|nr:MAG: hypothetical protein M1822_010051 [Bathelium mastoideum]